MAFCVKSNKDTLQVSSQTPAKVGPGSYTVITQSSHDQITRKHSAKAPFSTSVDRFDQHQFKALPPGPGSYEIIKESKGHSKNNVIFISNEERFSSSSKYLNKEEYLNPGPGSYSTNDTWIKDKLQNNPLCEKRILDFKRTCTIPSIPSKDHVNGYDEDEHGNIYLKENEECDEERSEINLSKNKCTDFGNSKTERSILFKRDEIPGPGPGQYDIKGNYKLNYKTSCFASKSKLTYQKEIKEYDTLRGPGDYVQITPNNIKRPLYSKKKYPQKEIIKEKILAKEKEETPGPGQYHLDPGSWEKSTKTSAGFNQTSSRFQKLNQNIPGPGEYKIENKWEIKKSKGQLSYGFGSTEDKMKEKMNNNIYSPGPCAYQAYQPQIPSLKKMSSPFKSKSSRFTQSKGPTIPDYSNIKEFNDMPRGDPGALGPGSYFNDTKNSFKIDFSKFSGFWSSSDRFSNIESKTTPGPGEYNNCFNNYLCSGSGSGSGSGSNNVIMKEGHFSYDKRFKDDVNRLSIPGPGHYNYDNTCMLKKSFNVTFES